MTKITIDNKGLPLLAPNSDGDQTFTEITSYFWRQLVSMGRQLLTSQAGGTLTITVEGCATMAEADLTLNPVAVAELHNEVPAPVEAVSPPSEASQGSPNMSLHVEASGNGFSALLSAHETHFPA